MLWTGSDDGVVILTRDNGATWTNVTPRNFPQWFQILSVQASSTDVGSAYIAATGYKLGDNRPVLYRTHDFGRNWQLVTTGLPQEKNVTAIRDDPLRPGLLFAGTEQGVYASFDDGAHWASLGGDWL